MSLVRTNGFQSCEEDNFIQKCVSCRENKTSISRVNNITFYQCLNEECDFKLMYAVHQKIFKNKVQ